MAFRLAQSRGVISGTSSMDRAVARGGLSRRTWLALAVARPAAASAACWPGRPIGSCASVDRAVDASRLQIAPVTDGNLVRDAAADGRIVSANAPTLFAATAGIVDAAGQGRRPGAGSGQVLATIDSPELRSRFTQEQTCAAVARRRARPRPHRRQADRHAQRQRHRARRGADCRPPSAISNAPARPSRRAC